MLPLLSEGLGQPALARMLLCVTVGAFFAISGYHKLASRERHADLVETLRADHVPLVSINQWWVPFVELTGGTALVFQLYPTIAALFLGIVCMVACFVDGRKRVEEFHPMDRADRLDDWLYLPDTLYLLMLLAIILI